MAQGGQDKDRYTSTGNHQDHLISDPRQPQQQMVFQQGVPFFVQGQQNLVQYGGLPQQKQPQYPMAYQNVLVRPHNQLYQPTNTFQPTAAAFIPSTDQSQNQGLFQQPQKPAQQPAAQQQTQQQPLKRKKRTLLIINPDTNKPINVPSPTTNKAPSKSPEPEPLPLVSPTTDAKREFQQLIGEALTKPSSVSSKAGSLDDRDIQLSQVLPGAQSQPLQVSNVNLQQPTHTPLLPNLSDKTRVNTAMEKKVEVESENKEPGKEPEMEIADIPKPVEESQIIQQPSWMSQYEKAVANHGLVSLNIIRCVLVGPPKVGKSCLKHLLVHNEPKEVTTSTPVLESPEVVTFSPKLYMTHQGSSSVWQPIKDMGGIVKKWTMEEQYETQETPPTTGINQDEAESRPHPSQKSTLTGKVSDNHKPTTLKTTVTGPVSSHTL